MLSVVCDAFGCTPTEAKELDYLEVKAILEYRLAQSAKAQHNRKVEDMSEAQVTIWKEMIKAAQEGE